MLLAVLAGGIKAIDMWKHFNQRLDSIISNTQDSSNMIALTIDGQEVRLDAKEKNDLVFELPSLNTEFAVDVSYTADPRYSLEFNGIPLINGQKTVCKFQSVMPDYYIPVTIHNNKTNEMVTFSLRTYPQGLPRFTVTGKSTYPRDYYITPMMPDGGAIYKIDDNGNVLFYKMTGANALDFKKVVTEDGIRYIYCEQVASQHSPLATTAPADYVVMDDHYHEIKRIGMQESDDITDSSWPSDWHDLLYVDDNEYYVMTYKNEYVKNIPDTIPQRKPDTLVTANIIQGFKDGKLFFAWDSTDYPELYGQSTEGNDYTNMLDSQPDYLHINSLDLDKRDGNLIASFRHLDSILKIDTTTGNILWTLGGKGDDFHLTPEQKTSHQHYARYNPAGSITAFDNGNTKMQSRVVEYWLDEDHKTLKDFKSYQVDGYFSSATGSAQRLSQDQDVFLIGWGMRDAASPSLMPNLSEINFTTGETLFELRFDDSTIQTYRCVKD